ncbi:MAG: YwbE family protein [Candidatus Kuenenbacteria bacterium]
MNCQNRNNIRKGLKVAIVQKEDQPTGELTRGVVQDILTSKKIHSRGIKVRLTNGAVGRVQTILPENNGETKEGFAIDWSA